MKRDLGTQQVLLLLVHGDKAMQDRRTMFVTEDGKQWGCVKQQLWDDI